MNLSAPFIRRPIATSLLALGLLLVGLVAYSHMPVSSLPAVDMPTIRVFASRPGADPATMAATVAAPLERRLGEIAGISEMTSTSTLGSTSIGIQFDLKRNIDSAARDVQAALNAAATDLPSDLAYSPSMRKMNPAAAPILILALTSDTIQTSALFDIADSVFAQKISQVEGVADVTVTGAEQPAIRVRVDPGRLAAMGIGIDTVRSAIVTANVLAPTGVIEGEHEAHTIAVNDQMNDVQLYRDLVVRVSNGITVRLGDIADVQRATRNARAAGWYNNKPSVVLMITRQAGANVIATVDRVRKVLPQLQAWVPAGVQVSVVNDRTSTIRASVAEMYRSLAISVVLVMAVVFAFLRRWGPVLAAGVTVPLSLAGAFVPMWAMGFSIDLLSLMAIIVAVGFVVDDAIVMIENIDRHRQRGLSALDAALVGSRQIGFTVLSISASLAAAFLPLLFMPGIVGRMFGEFSWTVVFAITTSAIISLTVTPAILARMRRGQAGAPPSRVGRWMDEWLAGLIAGYMRSLQVALRRPGLTSLTLIVTVLATVWLFGKVPKGFIPQDDTGLLIGFTEGSPDLAFPVMRDLQRQVNAIVMADPAVAGVASSVGGGGWGTTNQGRLFVSLKPRSERGVSSQAVIGRLRGKLNALPGIRIFMVPAQDLRPGARESRSQYQFTLWSPDLDELQAWVPKVLEQVKKVDGLVDVATDQEKGGLQTGLKVDRMAAARLGVKVSDIDSALSSAFSQRQISTMYGVRNQYKVVLEVEPAFSKGPNDISRLHVPSSSGAMVPLSALVVLEAGQLPLAVNHQGPFPAITITYNVVEGAILQDVNAALRKAFDDLRVPPSLRADFAGEAGEFSKNANSQPLLILTALLAIYILLGVLYESLIHPLTILSTLPSAGLGALLALLGFGIELSLVALVGMILLIGIVKKNGIMLVDFAVEAMKTGASAQDAVVEAARERFRPILMTTLASLLGALPLALGAGPGAALRQPLGVTIIGGLLVSQILTLYTTPALFLVLEKGARARFGLNWLMARIKKQPA